MYSKRKLFIFHNQKVINHIESQPNQSRYIETLILESIENPMQNLNLNTLLSLLQQHISTPSIPNKEPLPQSNISSSVFSILNNL